MNEKTIKNNVLEIIKLIIENTNDSLRKSLNFIEKIKNDADYDHNEYIFYQRYMNKIYNTSHSNSSGRFSDIEEENYLNRKYISIYKIFDDIEITHYFSETLDESAKFQIIYVLSFFALISNSQK
jgi:valyl-tRNA synthetase